MLKTVVPALLLSVLIFCLCSEGQPTVLLSWLHCVRVVYNIGVLTFLGLIFCTSFLLPTKLQLMDYFHQLFKTVS